MGLESNVSHVRLLHEELVLQYTLSSGRVADIAMSNSWFLFELIIKSMIEHLDNSGTLNAPRKQRFSHQFNEDVASLVAVVTNKVNEYHSTDPRLAQSLNASLSFLIFDLLSIMDRGFVFGLIKIYSKLITSRNAIVPDLMNYKLDFHRIVCSHEHFVALNFPFGTSYTTISAPCSPTPSTTSNTSQSSYVRIITIQISVYILRLYISLLRDPLNVRCTPTLVLNFVNSIFSSALC